MNDVTRILAAIEHGDPLAAEQLLPLVYDELRKLAAQRLAREPDGPSREAMTRIAQRPRNERKRAFVFVNNRLEGNAPTTIEAVAAQLSP
jgi:hypothetical protein